MKKPTEITRSLGEKIIQETFPEAFTRKGKIEITIRLFFPELTWKCPVQAYPDFGKITIWYKPRNKILELKSLKLWLNSYREKYIGHEQIATKIFETIWELIDPKELKIHLDINPRGNLKDDIIIQRP
jgi:7-cyano-7-deazaguanine reductase